MAPTGGLGELVRVLAIVILPDCCTKQVNVLVTMTTRIACLENALEPPESLARHACWWLGNCRSSNTMRYVLYGCTSQ